MTERSLFNVACKLIGVWLLFHAGSAFVWAFLASRFNHNYSVFDPEEDMGWSTGTTWLIVGAFLCCRSGWLTQLVFRIDPPLDSEPPAASSRRLMPTSSNATLDQASAILPVSPVENSVEP